MVHSDETRMDAKGEARLGHDRSAVEAALLYGRHFFEFWQSDLNRAVVELAGIQPNMTVLDIGAGMGAAAFEAVKRYGVTVVTVEPTAFMRTILKARVATRRLGSRVAVLNAGAQHLPVPSDSIDRAWMINVVHHVADLAAASSELARVMKPGGRVLIVDEDFTNETHPKYEQMNARHGGHGAHRHSGHRHGGDGRGDSGHVDSGHGYKTNHKNSEEGDDAAFAEHPMAIDFDELAKHLEAAGFSEIQIRHAILAGVPTRQAMAVR